MGISIREPSSEKMLGYNVQLVWHYGNTKDHAMAEFIAFLHARPYIKVKDIVSFVVSLEDITLFSRIVKTGEKAGLYLIGQEYDRQHFFEKTEKQLIARGPEALEEARRVQEHFVLAKGWSQRIYNVHWYDGSLSFMEV